MTTAAEITASVGARTSESEFDPVIDRLHAWLLARDYAGYEPYDLLNARYLGGWARHQPFATFFIQSGKRIGGLTLRRWLDVPPSRNPKALGLVLAAYCDLANIGREDEVATANVKRLLINLRSRGQHDFCWGYDWHYVSLRGACLPAFSPNSIATVFCANALLDHAETFADEHSRTIALSATRWLIDALQRSVEEPNCLCFSYTPHDRTRIFNNSALIGALLARVSQFPDLASYRDTARRIMQYLADGHASDGSWTYGAARSQSWIDSFHTGYNLCALVDYQRHTGDPTFSTAMMNGYDFYRSRFFDGDGRPRYFHDRTYPIDIHACSQAIITFCAFSDLDPTALDRAHEVARWTIANLLNPDGSFGYQVHRLWKDRTPYVRWSQAWMFRALACLRHTEVFA
jgi:hypothetical protein